MSQSVSQSANHCLFQSRGKVLAKIRFTNEEEKKDEQIIKRVFAYDYLSS